SFFGAPEPIGLHTNIFIPHINATNWFLQIVNRDPNGNPVSGTVCAKLADNAGMLLSCDSPPFVVAAVKSGGPLTLAWTSIPGENYAVEATSNLKTWATIKTIKATNTKTSFTPHILHGGVPHFYRIQQVPP